MKIPSCEEIKNRYASVFDANNLFTDAFLIAKRANLKDRSLRQSAVASGVELKALLDNFWQKKERFRLHDSALGRLHLFEEQALYILQMDIDQQYRAHVDYPEEPEDYLISIEEIRQRITVQDHKVIALDLSGLKIKKIPSSVNELIYLQRLDLSQSDIESTAGLIGLNKLEVLIFSDCEKLKEIGNLRHLEKIEELLFDFCPLVSGRNDKQIKYWEKRLGDGFSYSTKI